MQPKNFLPAVALFLFAPALLFARGVTIVSPAENSQVVSPVRVVADFPRTSPIASITVSVDHVDIPQPEAVTPLDVKIPMSQGSHLLTVTGTQSDGTVLSSSRWVTVSAPSTQTDHMTNSPNLDSPGIDGAVFNNIEEMSGWYTYPDYGHPVCSAKPQLVATPSMDGISGKFYLGPTGQYNNCLWPIKLGSSTSVMNFQLDTYYQLSNPSYSQGIEFSSNHHVGTAWYKFSVQCSYGKGYFSVWDTAGGKWSPTNIPCRRPAKGSWDHLTVKTQISGGKAVFLSLTLNGVWYPINKSFWPRTETSSYSYGVHFQMNGDIYGHAYYGYVDKLTFTAW